MFLRRIHYTQEYSALFKIESLQPFPSGTSPELLTRYYSNYTFTLYVGYSSFQCFCMCKREIFSRFILLSEGILKCSTWKPTLAQSTIIIIIKYDVNNQTLKGLIIFLELFFFIDKFG